MSNVNSFQLEQNESYAVIDWKAEQLSATNSEELENLILHLPLVSSLAVYCILHLRRI